MPATQSAGDDVLQMAIMMEELGSDFYEALAGVTRDVSTQDLCKRLAGEETRHRATFLKMRSELAAQGKTVLISDEKIAQARRALKADVLPNGQTLREAIASGKVSALLDLAIGMEHDAVAFYTRLAANVQDKTAIEAIIREEKIHARVLTEAKARLS
ncbi:MAG: ferritin family protein [Planctomycetaceae bacterium]|nr:ferritin family protein [Planctomycetaceae bacterium]